MIFIKTYEQFEDYQPMPFDSPKLTSYSQQTPNGLATQQSNDNCPDQRQLEPAPAFSLHHLPVQHSRARAVDQAMDLSARDSHRTSLNKPDTPLAHYV